MNQASTLQNGLFAGSYLAVLIVGSLIFTARIPRGAYGPQRPADAEPASGSPVVTLEVAGTVFELHDAKSQRVTRASPYEMRCFPVVRSKASR